MATCQMTKMKLVKQGTKQKKESVGVCGLMAQEGSVYCPRHTFLANIATHDAQIKDLAKSLAKDHGIEGRLPQTRVEMRKTGYEFKNEGECTGCHLPIEWWLTPSSKRAPFNPMPADHTPAVSHFATCKNVAEFRRAS